VVVGFLLMTLQKSNQDLRRRVSVAGSVCVSLAGAYWFIQRVFF
jgi:hypothetical protein